MNKNPNGFSLIELMVTLGIAAIVLAFGVPSMTRIVDQVRVDTETTSLMEGFTLARHFAVNAKSYVTVCGSSDGSSCDGNWETGLFAYSHQGNNAGYSNDTDTPSLFYKTNNDTFTTIGNIKKFTFRPSGLLKGKSGSLLYCPIKDTVTNLRRLTVSKGGRVRVYTPEEIKQKKYLSQMNCP